MYFTHKCNYKRFNMKETGSETVNPSEISLRYISINEKFEMDLEDITYIDVVGEAPEKGKSAFLC